MELLTYSVHNSLIKQCNFDNYQQKRKSGINFSGRLQSYARVELRRADFLPIETDMFEKFEGKILWKWILFKLMVIFFCIFVCFVYHDSPNRTSKHNIFEKLALSTFCIHNSSNRSQQCTGIYRWSDDNDSESVQIFFPVKIHFHKYINPRAMMAINHSPE